MQLKITSYRKLKNKYIADTQILKNFITLLVLSPDSEEAVAFKERWKINIKQEKLMMLGDSVSGKKVYTTGGIMQYIEATT